jgi:hypothetical protein
MNPTPKDLAALPKSRVEITVTQDGETWTLEVPVARVRFDQKRTERPGWDEEFRIFPLPPLEDETVLSVHMCPELQPGARYSWKLTKHTKGVNDAH